MSLPIKKKEMKKRRSEEDSHHRENENVRPEMFLQERREVLEKENKTNK